MFRKNLVNVFIDRSEIGPSNWIGRLQLIVMLKQTQQLSKYQELEFLGHYRPQSCKFELYSQHLTQILPHSIKLSQKTLTNPFPLIRLPEAIFIIVLNNRLDCLFCCLFHKYFKVFSRLRNDKHLLSLKKISISSNKCQRFLVCN